MNNIYDRIKDAKYEPALRLERVLQYVNGGRN